MYNVNYNFKGQTISPYVQSEPGNSLVHNPSEEIFRKKIMGLKIDNYLRNKKVNNLLLYFQSKGFFGGSIPWE